MDPQGPITARISEDPLQSAAIGSKLKFSYKLFAPLPFSGLRYVENREAFDGALLGMMFHQEGVYRSLGSAAMVAPGIALAASHVVEAARDSLMNGGGLVYGHTKSNLMLWRIYQFTLLDNSDLAILLMEARSNLPEGNNLTQLKLTTRLPERGEPVFVCGIRPAAEHFLKVEGNFKFATGAYAATGQVLDVYPAGRDLSKMPWSSFAFECETVGGMSGGPVFDKYGHLVGLLSTGYDGQSLSFASLIGPAVAEKLSPIWPPGIHRPSSSLSEMRELCVIDPSAETRHL